MALTRKEKESIVEKVRDAIKNATSVVFVRFHGISVADAAALRKDLRARDVGYTVVKKTLAKRALDAASVTGEQPEFPGELAIAYGKDEVAPAQGVAGFMKKFEERVSLSGGILEGRYIGKEEALALSRIPSRQTLYGQFAVVLNSPIQGTVGVLSGVLRSFAVALQQIAEKKI